MLGMPTSLNMEKFLIQVKSINNSYMTLVTKMAVNRLIIKPRINVHANPFTGPVPTAASITPVIKVVTLESNIAENAFS